MHNHTVVAGETLFLIARKYGKTVTALIAANPGINPDLIRPGQIIVIP